MTDDRDYSAQTFLDQVSEYLSDQRYAELLDEAEEAEALAVEEAAPFVLLVDDVVVGAFYTEDLADLEAQVASHVQDILGYYSHDGAPLTGEVRVEQRRVA